MKKSRKLVQIVSVTLGSVLVCGALTAFAGCGGGDDKDALVIMSEDLNGLFNPFYSTAGTDMDVVGQTQISMLNTDEQGGISYGDKEPVVVKDYTSEYNSSKDQTTYTFVLKNGIVFSDGVPLTMNDVMFNIYVYLDPAYTGSTTMYSTDIVGLKEYRLQNNSAGSTAEDDVTRAANGRAANRVNTLQNLFTGVYKKNHPGETNPTSYNVTPAEMRSAINNLTSSDIATFNLPWEAYKKAIAANGTISDDAAKAQLLADYNQIAGTTATGNDGLFWKELEEDWNAAQSTFAEAPYTNQPGKEQTNFSGVTFDEVTSFLAYEGLVEIKYLVEPGKGTNYNHITEVNNPYTNISSKDAALNYVYQSWVNGQFHNIFSQRSTGSQVRNEYNAYAKGIIMQERIVGTGMRYKNISGIKSLGHLKDGEAKVDKVTVNGKDYTVAQEHNADGTPKSGYDVLQITINGKDPKAIWNFGFTVAPWHYYSDPSQEDLQVDIKNDKFGVKWSDFSFHTGVLQGNAKSYNGINYGNVTKNGVPLGAGPYVATNSDNGDYPSYAGFMSNNVVYYKANERFFEGVENKDESLHAPYIKKMRYQVISSSNAIPSLQQGAVDYVEPQLTSENFDTLQEMKGDGFTHVETWQLGYGYIGINAGKVTNLNLRKAIMAAMDTNRARSYYREGTVATIYWPMSLVSWAYPRVEGTSMDPNDYLKNKKDDNKHDYIPNIPSGDSSDARRIELIKNYTAAAKASGAQDSALKVTFTIAGSSLTEHPCYAVFQHAKTLLEQCGWNITISPDVNALTKLATGSLTVWAAAWGSTIDPDMYQVYHKNSTATSVLAWGYPYLLANGTQAEQNLLNELSDLIDRARETDVNAERIPLYEQAMSKALDLAIELPVYQRQVMYAYNSDVIDPDTLPKTINPYSSPLSRIWEVNFR